MTLDKLQSMMRRVRQLAFRLVGGSCLLLLFAVPVAAFVKLSGLVGVPRAGAAGAWHPSQPLPIPAVLTSMPTTGWTLDNGATITTDSDDVLVLRPLTYGRPSLPGQGPRLAGRILAAAQYCAPAELPANVIPLRRAA
jgi:hypothetical protein